MGCMNDFCGQLNLSHDQDHESVQVHMFKHCADGGMVCHVSHKTMYSIYKPCKNM